MESKHVNPNKNIILILVLVENVNLIDHFFLENFQIIHSNV